MSKCKHEWRVFWNDTYKEDGYIYPNNVSFYCIHCRKIKEEKYPI